MAAIKDKLVTVEDLDYVLSNRVESIENGGTNAATIEKARENLHVPTVIAFGSTDWSDINKKMRTINMGAGATFVSSLGTVSSVLTGGKVSSSLKGVMSAVSNTTYDIFAMVGNGSTMVAWRITNPSDSGGTIGTIYRYTGTAI